MNFDEALQFVEDCKYGHGKDYRALKKVLSILNFNENNFKIIQIAGTNGKGSVGTFLSDIIFGLNNTVGHFTSPHLIDYRERFKVNTEMISKNYFIEIVEEISENIDIELKEKLTYFEMSFIVALLVFKKEKVKYIIIETGIGGRYDITNIFKNNILSIITTVDLDHISTLGNTVEKIAYHKAGIIKENSKVISFKHSDSIDKIIRKESILKNSDIKFLDTDSIDILNTNIEGSEFIFKNKKLETKMLGVHQIYNICLSILALEELNIKYDFNNLYEIIKKLFFEGRMEVIYKNPKIIIDGAHNAEGLNCLNKNLEKIGINNYILVIGSMSDKDIFNQIKKMAENSKFTIFTEIEYSRAEDSYKMAEKIELEKKQFKVIKPVDEVIKYILDNFKENTIIITGSFYLIGEFKKKLNKEEYNVQ